jgi:hypothetical protein
LVGVIGKASNDLDARIVGYYLLGVIQELPNPIDSFGLKNGFLINESWRIFPKRVAIQ